VARVWFGTDGIRGLANERLSADLALRVGRALGLQLRSASNRIPTVAIGRDTRRSGPMLEDALCAGVTSSGVDVVRLGVTATPAVAWDVRTHARDAGVVISASHNPFPDNGIKVFGGDGFKLDDGDEESLERLIDADISALPTGAEIGGSTAAGNHAVEYAAWIAEACDVDLGNPRIVVDCANGAAAAVAPVLFERLGVDPILIGATPDGININDGCGSTHLPTLAAAVQANGAELGVAFDGDADRVLFVDANGTTVDGDHILAILARDRIARNALPGGTVVVTSMANLGAHRALTRLGCNLIVTDVGDRYVLQAMRERGAVLGGEQSGHVITLDRQTTGDGPLTAVQLLAALARADQPLAEAAALVEKFPQRLIGVPADRAALAGNAIIAAAVAEAEASLGEDGRIVVRASGTEPLVRVMVEALDSASCDTIAESLAELIATTIPPTTDQVGGTAN
jgi:phosphoglucosamine mutase